MNHQDRKALIEADADFLGVLVLRLNLLVESRVVVELKAIEALLPVHKAQVLTCLKLSGHRLGLLINFNSTLIIQGIQRITL